jgi:serine/threonine-protein kinase
MRMAVSQSPDEPAVSLIPQSDLAQRLGLPPRLQGEIRRRLFYVALIGIAAFGAYTVHAILTGGQVLDRHPINVISVLSGIALSAMLAVLSRDRGMALERLLVYALTFQVLSCFVISISAPAYLTAEGSRLPMVTWVTPIIIMFPLLIPVPRAWALRASLLCAATVPLGTLIALSRLQAYWEQGPKLVESMISPAIAVVIATFGAKFVYESGVRQNLGSYTLIREIGKGGMGVVYEAKHNRLLRRAAVKQILNSSLTARFGDRDVALQRFEKEAHVLAGLRSQHTVDLYDYGVDDGGRVYFAMELLDGWDLESLVLKYGPQPAERVVHILVQVCRSLAEAHAQNIVHRDIKPANIMVCRHGLELDFVKVLDFGLMTAPSPVPVEIPGTDGDPGGDPAVPPGGDNPRLTTANIVMGTPDFMAPEQVAMKGLDGRSDIYASGCVGYWLLTGTLLFPGEAGAAATMRAHLRTIPPTPSKRLGREVCPELERVIMACLAKDPADRPQTADALRRSLLAAASPPGWTEEAAETWWRDRDPKKERASIPV